MQSVDIGFVFALHHESVGILDRLKRPQTTRGNDRTFHTGTIHTAGTNSEKSVAAVLAGVGQKNAEEATNVLLDVFAPRWICSIGYAGGLTNRLQRATICVPEQAVRATDGQALDLSGTVPQRAVPMPNKLKLLTINDVVETPNRKRELHAQTGAELVDMETFAVAEVCRVREIPFLSVRVIFDALDDQIPGDITKILDNFSRGVSRTSGLFLAGTLFGSIVSRPSVLLDFASFNRRAFTASERLAQFTLAELSRRNEAKMLPSG